MRKTDKIMIIFLISALCFKAMSQDEIKEVKVNYNQVEGYLLYKLKLNYAIDEMKNLESCMVEIRNEVDNELDNKLKKLDIEPVYGPRHIIFKVPGLDIKTLEALSDDKNRVYLKSDRPIEMVLVMDDDKKVYKLKPAALKEATLGNMVISEDDSKEYKKYIEGSIIKFDNKFDFGLTQDGQNDLYADFRLGSSVPLGLKARFQRFHFNTEGRISTNPDDSLNYLNLYPVNLKLNSKSNYKYDILLKIGSESSQNFEDWMVSGELSFKSIIPNFINLTFGEERFRLKPVLNIGGKFYTELQNSRFNSSNVSSAQAFCDLYYFIPIADIYFALFEGGVFYDFSTERNPGEEFFYHYDISLGTKVPGQDIKLMLKYSYADNETSLKRNDQVLIGVIWDLFEKNLKK